MTNYQKSGIIIKIINKDKVEGGTAMIRRLTEKDHTRCYELLKRQSAENLFIIGDIEAYGYEQKFQKLWGEINDNGELVAVLLKYEENYIPYATDSFNVKEFATIINNDPEFLMLCGLEKFTTLIEPYIKKELKRKRKTYYAKCTSINREMNLETSIVNEASPEDAEGLVDLILSVPEFEDTTTTVEKMRRNLENGTSRSYFIVQDKKIVSTVSTAAENSMSAMVVGVATREGYKRRGYATRCLLKLCQQLINEDKELCLFYDNEDAGAIYKRIGFDDIGFWMMYSYK